MQNIYDVHPIDRTAEVARRLDAISAILWELAAAHGNLPQLADADDMFMVAQRLDRELDLLDHYDEDVRGIAESAARCGSIACDIETAIAEANIPFI